MRGRSRALALLVAFAFVLVGFPTAAHAGSSDELVLPPGPSCDETAFTTTPALTDDGYNVSDPNLGDGAGGLATRASFPVAFGAGTVSLDEIITWDAHIDRDTNFDQTNERVVVEFSLNGSVVATSSPTADLAEGPLSAWEVNNLGSLVLAEGADSAAVVHAGGTAAINSVVVTSVCMTFTADAPPLPAPECDDNPATPDPAEGCPEPEPEPACDDNPATPDPAEGCPEPPVSSCEDGDPDPDCDLEPEPACDDEPATPEPAEGCPEPEPEPEPEPACDDDPATPDPAEGCDKDVLPEPDPEPEPEPTPEPGDQAPELAITGAYSGSMAAGAMILMILGGSAAFVAGRNRD